MKTKEIIGIDISKLTIDVCIYSNKFSNCFENNKQGFKKMLDWIFKNTSFLRGEILFVFEHTGLYSHNISIFLESNKLFFCIVPGLEIKRSLGIVRGKDDQVDAQRIALYGYRLREELTPSKSVDNQIKKMHSLLSLRTRLVRQKAGFIVSLKEQKSVYKVKDNKTIFEVQKSLIKTFSAKIKKIEKELMLIVKQDEELKKIFDLITSIKGVGCFTALTIIVHTNRFTKFKTWRKFASYCGIAPFPYRSGTSVKGRTKVSHLANKEIKSLLNMCAISAIQCNPEMQQYYEKRVNQGRNKMSTLNIIRNKLVARIFAVVNRETPYVDTLKYAS